MACGKKFEKGHEKHYCQDCGNRDSETCRLHCFFNINCCFRPQFGTVDETFIGGTP